MKTLTVFGLGSLVMLGILFACDARPTEIVAQQSVEEVGNVTNYIHGGLLYVRLKLVDGQEVMARGSFVAGSMACFYKGEIYWENCRER